MLAGGYEPLEASGMALMLCTQYLHMAMQSTFEAGRYGSTGADPDIPQVAPAQC